MNSSIERSATKPMESVVCAFMFFVSHLEDALTPPKVGVLLDVLHLVPERHHIAQKQSNIKQQQQRQSTWVGDCFRCFWT